MPRLSPLILSLAILLAAAVNTGATPLPGGLLSGRGNATTFTIYGEGSRVTTGPDQATLVCLDCLVRIAFTSADIQRMQSQRVDFIDGGAFEFREFAGAMDITDNGPYDFDFNIVGHGEFNELR